MKSVYKVFVVIITLSLNSCVTLDLFGFNKIVRWSKETPEIINSEYNIISKKSIFNDYDWTTPNVGSIEIAFNNEVSDFTMCETGYQLTRNGEVLILENPESGYKSESVIKKSNGDYYYNIRNLKEVTKVNHRWVPKTTYEYQSTPVHKTRQVPVTSTDALGNTTTSFRTEFYIDYEYRYVPVTSWVWEAYTTTSIEIPDYEYYEFDLENDLKILVYKVESNGIRKYYLQNVSYKYVHINGNDLFGKNELRIILIDSNSNGSYFDSTDSILFNSWNPYSKESRYKSVKGFIDNKWYNLSYVEKNKLLVFDYDKDRNMLNINNLNSEYAGVKDTGEFTISNIQNEKSKMYLNGNKYEIFNMFGKNIKYKCEYGKYVLRVSNPGFKDFETTFEINEENPSININYVEQDKSGILKIKKIFSDNFSVIVTAEGAEEKIYTNQTEISVPDGESNIEIYYDGFVFQKRINVESESEFILDFEEEIKAVLEESDT